MSRSNPIIKILMTRDKLSYDEAVIEFRNMVADVKAGEDPEEVLFGHGLEPDYIFDLLPVTEDE